MAASQSKLEHSLLKTFNHLNLQSLTLREEQVNAIRNIVENQKDVLVVLLTGFGKSLIFQLLPFVFDLWLDIDDSFILVVSPVNVLMRYQIIKLQNLHVPTLMVCCGKLAILICEHNCSFFKAYSLCIVANFGHFPKLVRSVLDYSPLFGANFCTDNNNVYYFNSAN